MREVSIEQRELSQDAKKKQGAIPFQGERNAGTGYDSLADLVIEDRFAPSFRLLLSALL